MHRLEIASDKNATTWEDITALVDWTSYRFAGVANRGEIETGSGFDLADDAGTRTLPKRRRVRLIEDATTPDTVMWQGRTVAAGIARGTRFDGNARQFDVMLVDTNGDFGGIGFAGSHRPAETDVQRIQFLRNTYINGQSRPSTVIGAAYFNTGNPVNLVKHSYIGVQLIDWFTHITDTSGKQFFLTKDYDLFYDLVTSTAYAAGLSITDVSPNHTTSFPPGEPERHDDGTELYSGVRFRYYGSKIVQVVRSAVETANDQWRTSIADDSVKTLAAATSRANRFLDEFDHDRVVYRCWVDLDETQVALISWGMTVSFRSGAVGITSPTTLRVARLNWEKVAPTRWRAHLELNYPTKFGKASVGGGSGNPGTPPATAPLPFVPGTTPSPLTQAKTAFEQVDSAITVDADDGWLVPTTGRLLVAWHSARSGTAFTFNTPTGWTAHPLGTVDGGVDRGALYWKIADGSESSITFTLSGGTRHALTVMEFAVAPTLDANNEATGTSATVTTGSVTPTAGQSVIIVGGAAVQTSDSVHTMTPSAGWTEVEDSMIDNEVEGGFHPLHWVAYQQVASASGSYNPTGTVSAGTPAFGGQTLAFTATATVDDAGSPVQGQVVVEDVFEADGTTTPGSPTTYPYAERSLVILVNGVDMEAALTETDPAAGTYSLLNAPPTGAEVVVRYISTGEGS